MSNFFTIKQVAFILKVHHLTVRRYIREKKLIAVKFGGGIRIKEDDLQTFQKEYSAREHNTSQSLLRESVKAFSLSDPLWKLNGFGASLSLPENS